MALKQRHMALKQRCMALKQHHMASTITWQFHSRSVEGLQQHSELPPSVVWCFLVGLPDEPEESYTRLCIPSWDLILDYDIFADDRLSNVRYRRSMTFYMAGLSDWYLSGWTNQLVNDCVGSKRLPHCVQGQLMGVALSFLRNFGILSGASGVLGALSSGVASAALDDRFAVQRAQQKQVCLSFMFTHGCCLRCRHGLHAVGFDRLLPWMTGLLINESSSNRFVSA